MFISGAGATVLQKAQVRIINHAVCNQLMTDQITSRMICAGVLTGGVDACQVSFMRLLTSLITGTEAHNRTLVVLYHRGLQTFLTNI